MSLNLDFSSVSLTWWGSSAALGLKGHFMTHSPRHRSFCWCTETIHISRTPPPPQRWLCPSQPWPPSRRPSTSSSCLSSSLALSLSLMVWWSGGVFGAPVPRVHICHSWLPDVTVWAVQTTREAASPQLCLCGCVFRGGGCVMDLPKGIKLSEIPPHLGLCLSSLHWANTSADLLVLYVFIICTIKHPAWCVLRNRPLWRAWSLRICVCVCVLRLFFSSQLYFILYPHFIAISYKILKRFFLLVIAGDADVSLDFP